MFPRHSSHHRTSFRKETQKRCSHATRPNTEQVSKMMFSCLSSQHRTIMRKRCSHPARPKTEPVSETMFPRRSSQRRTGVRNDVSTPLVPTPNQFQKRYSHSARPNTEPVSETMFPRRLNDVPDGPSTAYPQPCRGSIHFAQRPCRQRCTSGDVRSW